MTPFYPVDLNASRLTEAGSIPSGEFFLLPEDGKLILSVNVTASRNGAEELCVILRLAGPHCFDIVPVPRHRMLRSPKVIPLGIDRSTVDLAVLSISNATKVQDDHLTPGAIAFSADGALVLAARWPDVNNPTDVSVVYIDLGAWMLDGHPSGGLAIDSWVLRHRAPLGKNHLVLAAHNFGVVAEI
jgi:hypothetical protein